MIEENLAIYASPEMSLIDALTLIRLAVGKLYASPLLSIRGHETACSEPALLMNGRRRTSQSSGDEKIRPQEPNFQDQENVSPPTSIAEQIGYSPLTGSNVYMDLQHQVKPLTLSISLSSIAKGRSSSKTKQGATSILLA